jgi:hypothetical protein
VGTIQATSNQWEARQVKKALGQLAAVLRPAHHISLQGVDGFRDPMNNSMNRVSAWPPGISHHMVEGIGPDEVKEEFNLK